MNSLGNADVRVFLECTRADLAEIEDDLAFLGHAPSDDLVLWRVYWNFRTINETASLFRFMKLHAVAESAACLSLRVYYHEVYFDATILHAAMAAIGAIRQMLDLIERTGIDGDCSKLN